MMPSKPPLCLNMIVKNEAARIERCLVSVLPYVRAAAILDTGSTDDTKEVIRDICGRFDVPVEIRDGAFIDWSQARNEAFKVAKDARDVLPWCQFVLLADADMELVVTTPDAFAHLDANAGSYDMMQYAGSMSYGNRRIVNLDWGKDPYIGVTHEYIDIPAAGMISGAHYLDHADGSNRHGKFDRDAYLLERDLKKDPNNPRSWFYLANTYRDMGRHAMAGIAYKRRIELGGWDEEVHNAMLCLADCLRHLGKEDEFVAAMVEAYAYRPTRAEPLYELAKYFRERNQPQAALIYAKAGLDMPRPDDLLFVNDHAYKHGLRYEYSIAGYYDEREKPRAMRITNELALDPTCDHDTRWSARSNLFWCTQPLRELCPSFQAGKLEFDAPAGYTAMNPSVDVHEGRILCNIRCVNYRINEHGQYTIDGVPMYDGGPPISTRNFLCTLNREDYSVGASVEVLWDRPAPLFAAVLGLEDIRLWRHDDNLMFSATVRECSPRGVCQIISGELTGGLVEHWRIISDADSYEKNWMPLPDRLVPQWMYRLDVVASLDGSQLSKSKRPSNYHVGDISGSSQLIKFRGGYLAITHEASNDPTTGKRTYWHRFAFFDTNLVLRDLSKPFVFFDRQIEFCAGLARLPDGKLLMSFGVRDEEAWVATVQPEEVASLLWMSK